MHNYVNSCLTIIAKKNSAMQTEFFFDLHQGQSSEIFMSFS